MFNATQAQECRHKRTCSMQRAHRGQGNGSDVQAQHVSGDETFPFPPSLSH